MLDTRKDYGLVKSRRALQNLLFSRLKAQRSQPLFPAEVLQPLVTSVALLWTRSLRPMSPLCWAPPAGCCAAGRGSHDGAAQGENRGFHW